MDILRVCTLAAGMPWPSNSRSAGEPPGPGNCDLQADPLVDLERSVPRDQLGKDPMPQAPGWAQLLDVALPFDCNRLDEDMREFLAGIGGLGATQADRAAGTAWRFWFAVMTAVFAARQAARGDRWWRRLTPHADRPGAPPARPRGLPGPWPLSLS
jgi:hypothetical protein